MKTCSQPWTHIEFTRDRLLPCCHSTGEVYEPGKGLVEYFNAPLMERTRSGLAVGNLPEECRNCRWSCSRAKIGTEGFAWPPLADAWFQPAWWEWRLCNERKGPSDEFKANLEQIWSCWQANTQGIAAVPPYVTLQFDQSCNIRCRMCIQRHLPPAEAVSMETVAAIIRDHRKIGRLYVTGGEPFHSDLARAFFRECGKRKLHFSLFFSSNLSCLDVGIIEAMNVQRIQGSCSGATKATYEFMHRGASWEAAMEALKRLAAMRQAKKNPVILSTNFVLFNINIRELPDAIRRDLALGIPTICGLGTPPVPCPQWDCLVDAPDGPAMPEKLQILRDCLAIPGLMTLTRDYLRGILNVLEAAHVKAGNLR